MVCKINRWRIPPFLAGLDEMNPINASRHPMIRLLAVMSLCLIWSTAIKAPASPSNNYAKYNLVGFGEGTTGGGVVAETDATYRKVSTPLEFATAIRDANKKAGQVRVIEILNDLNLGWNEIDPSIKALVSTPFSSAIAPKLHPVLLATGVSTVQISPRSGLTIFSAKGATIRHASWSIKNTSNIIIRNLKFDELWEWDEESKGDYDKNNWDFIVIGVGAGTVSQLWVDHCTFTKSYDGIIDTKGGASRITYSSNKYTGDDGATNLNSFVWQQINALESNKVSHAMYDFLRTRGFSPIDVVTIIQGSGKTHAIGELSLDPVNMNSSVTFHHQWYINPWDRLPRLAGGTVHNYNIYVDAKQALAARRLRDDRAAAMSPSDQNTLNKVYSFKPSLNGSISTENGAMLVENSLYMDCLWPLRNNQTAPSNPTYTGKIMALDTIYKFDEKMVRGNSTDPGNPLGPSQAPVIPFSWNTNMATPNGHLPYTYTMDDPAELQAIVTSPTSGAGAGVLGWNKTNWLMTTH
jgi:pectate lyase